MSTYLTRIRELRGLVDDVARIAWSDPRWWAVVAAVAAGETRAPRASYLQSDAGPSTDTFMAWPAAAPATGGARIVEAIALARAARAAITELAGALDGQPLAGTIELGREQPGLAPGLTRDELVDRSFWADGARWSPSKLEHAAVAVGDRVATLPLAAPDATLARAIAALARGEVVAPLEALGGARPFCAVSLGDDPWGVARHGHRRAWTAAGGPWLGLARSGADLLVSTSHYAVDGVGHALLCQRIAAALAAGVPSAGADVALPPLAPVADPRPLGVATRRWPAGARATALAYRLGVALGGELGVQRGMSPTVQVPVAPGARGDPDSWRRRVLPALVSVRWENGDPEPAAAFAARARAAFAREAEGKGLVSRVNAAARALPVPVRWKRRVAAGGRARWLAPVYEVIAGRACLSLIRVDGPAPPLVAVSGPTQDDAIGACVVTLVDDGTTATLTVCGNGRWSSDAACAAFLDALT